MEPNGLSRIDKLFVDRDQIAPNTARERRAQFSVSICCGRDVAGSYVLQVAALTAARLAGRCFPGAVRVVMDETLQHAPIRLWHSLNLTIQEAFALILGRSALGSDPAAGGASIVLGDAPAGHKALRLTFDGWIAKVGPALQTDRLPEREYCSLAGVLGAALAVSEIFLSFADISVEASRRTAAMSLWQPGADITSASALGVPIEYLPRSLWVLGLGHLGNAYLWSLATLPYSRPADVTLYLNDYDIVEAENVETCVLVTPNDLGSLKTRVCSTWLARHEFDTRVVERAFDGDFRRRGIKPATEPALALSGFDSNPVRRDLATAQFARVVESGLGSTASNFDTLSLHTLPNPRPPAELWPDLTPEEVERRRLERERIARENLGYLALPHDECGRYELTGKAVGVPFVGAAAASFVAAEVLRLLHGGPSYTDLKYSLAEPSRCVATARGQYGPRDVVEIDYTEARPAGG